MRSHKYFLFSLIVLLSLVIFAQSDSYARIPDIYRDKDIVFPVKKSNIEVAADVVPFPVKDRDVVYFGKPRYPDNVQTNVKLFLKLIEDSYYRVIDLWEKYVLQK